MHLPVATEVAAASFALLTCMKEMVMREGEQPPMAPARSDQLNPGDEAAPGTPGTGENLCPDCSGTGRRDGGSCATCGGTGKIIEGIGGA